MHEYNNKFNFNFNIDNGHNFWLNLCQYFNSKHVKFIIRLIISH